MLPHSRIILMGLIVVLLMTGMPLQPAQANYIAHYDQDALRAALMPHRALYGIQLASKKSDSQILAIRGQMLFEWREDCEGWHAAHRFNLTYEYAEQPSLRITSNSQTYEPYDGEGFSFLSKRKRNGLLYQEIRGHAARSGDENGFYVHYRAPDELRYQLPENTYFPMGHTLSVLDHMLTGKKMLSATVFDGSNEDGLMEISSFIGAYVNLEALQAQAEASPVLDAALLAVPARQVRMAFFPLDSQEADAKYEMDANVHENGIISAMTVEYRDFSVRQRLLALEPLPSATCRLNASGHEQRH